MIIDNQLLGLILVDDDEDDRFLLRQALHKAKIFCHVIEFTNGAEFVQYLQQEFDQNDGEKILWPVVLDLNLPGMDGIEILQMMRQHPLWQQIQVLMMTGQDEPDQAAKLRIIGATEYIAKPSTMDELSQRIKPILADWLRNPVIIQARER